MKNKKGMIHFIYVTPAGPISSTQVIGLRGALKIPPPPTISQLQDILPTPNIKLHTQENNSTPPHPPRAQTHILEYFYIIYTTCILFLHF